MNRQSLIIIVFLLVVLPNVRAANYTISSCADDPNTPGTWVLSQNLSVQGDCLNVTAAPVFIDCGPFGLKGNGSGVGISGQGVATLTLESCSIESFAIGLQAEHTDVFVHDSFFRNNSFGIITSPVTTSEIRHNVFMNNTISLNNTDTTPIIGESIRYVLADRNYWGTENLTEINNTVDGIAAYRPFFLLDPRMDNDGDRVPLYKDTCPYDADPLQTDSDNDTWGDICDFCPSMYDIFNQDNDNDTAGNTCDADDDNDGVSDATDNCQLVSNAAQTDTDADGVGDSCDVCSTVYNPYQEDKDTDGMGDACDTDDDGDSLNDTVDNCPLFVSTDLTDSDGDGAGDVCDVCVSIPNPDQLDSDQDGKGDICDVELLVPLLQTDVRTTTAYKGIARVQIAEGMVGQIDVTSIQVVSDDGRVLSSSTFDPATETSFIMLKKYPVYSSTKENVEPILNAWRAGSTVGVPYNNILLYLALFEPKGEKQAQAISEWVQDDEFPTSILDSAFNNLTSKLNVQRDNFVILTVDPCSAFAIPCTDADFAAHEGNESTIHVVAQYTYNGTAYNVSQPFTLSIDPERVAAPHSPGWKRGDLHFHSALSSSAGYNRRIDLLPGVDPYQEGMDDCPQEGTPRIDIDDVDSLDTLISLLAAFETTGDYLGFMDKLWLPGKFAKGVLSVGTFVALDASDVFVDDLQDLLQNKLILDAVADPGFTIPEIADQMEQRQVDFIALSDHSYCMRDKTVWNTLKTDEATVNAGGKVIIDVGFETSTREPYRYDRTAPGAGEVAGESMVIYGISLAVPSLEKFNNREGICSNFDEALNPVLQKFGLTMYNTYLNPIEGTDSTHMNVHNLDDYIGNVLPIYPAWARCPLSPYLTDALSILHGYQNADGSRPITQINHPRIISKIPPMGLMRWGDTQQDVSLETGLELVNGDFWGEGDKDGDLREQKTYTKNNDTLAMWTKELLEGRRTYAFSASDSHREVKNPEHDRVFLSYVFFDDSEDFTKSTLFDNLYNGRSIISNVGLVDLQIKDPSTGEFVRVGEEINVDPGDPVELKVEHKLIYNGGACNLHVYKGIIGDDHEEVIYSASIDGNGVVPTSGTIKDTIGDKRVYYRADCEADRKVLLNKVKEKDLLERILTRLVDGVVVSTTVDLSNTEPSYEFQGLRAFTNPIWVTPMYVNSSTSLGAGHDEFFVGDALFAKGRILDQSNNVNVVVVEDKHLWSDEDSLDSEFSLDGLVINYFSFHDKIKDLTLDDVGKYDIVVDVNKNLKWDVATEPIDGRKDTGFTVKCTPDSTANGMCGRVFSSNSVGKKKDAFLLDSDTVYGKLKVFSEFDQDVNILVLQELQLTEGMALSGQNLKATVPATLKAGEISLEVKKLGKAGVEFEEGIYQIVIDANKDGLFESGVDVYDPNGFSVVKEIAFPSMAVDSSGNLHVVAVVHSKAPAPANYRIDKVMYAKIPADDGALAEIQDPELFDWSEATDVTFTEIASHSGGTVSFTDIAVDSHDEPFIVYEIGVSGFHWLLVRKLDQDAKPDRCYDRSDQSVASAADKSNCDGSGSELLTYHWDDFEDIGLHYPSIAVDPTTDQPVISSEVQFTYPDVFYFNYIYPSCFIGFELVPVIITSVPVFAPLLTLKATPIQFFGDSVAIAKRIPGHAGTAQWPFGAGTFDSANKKFLYAANDVNSCLGDIATTSPRGDKNWAWLTVDEQPSIAASYDVSKVLVDSTGLIHMVYRNETGQRLYYITHDGTSPSSVTEVSSEAPTFWKPGFALDQSDTAHFAWQSRDSVLYTFMTSNGPKDPPIKVATLPTVDTARVGLAVDSDNNPHMTWLEHHGEESVIKYAKGSDVVFNPEFKIQTLTDSTDFVTDDGYVTFPTISSNLKATDNDWEDKIFVGWVNRDELTTFRYRRTTPHPIFMLVLDGIDTTYLEDHLSDMPALQKLIDTYPSIRVSTTASFPDTTMSAEAEMFTGLEAKGHHVYGDQFGSKLFVPDKSPNPSEVNNILSDAGVTTLFDALETVKRSKAALPGVVTKGVTGNSPDRLYDAQISFQTGGVTNDQVRQDLLSDMDNNDNTIANDVPNIVSAYVLVHDHGKYMQVDDISPAKIDENIQEIVEALDKKKMTNDTIIVLVGDYALTDVQPGDGFSLSNDDLSNLTNPNGVTLTKLGLNGRVAYSDDGISAARVYANNSLSSTSEWFGGIEKIFLKNSGGTYDEYNYNGSDVISPTSDPRIGNIVSSDSPSIVMIAQSGFYFHPEQKAMVDGGTLPFWSVGKGMQLFMRDDASLPSTIDLKDVAPTLAFFVGGQHAVDAFGEIDGENFYDPELFIEGGSPVDFHLTDSQNRHVGKNIYGEIDRDIPGSDLVVDPQTGKKRITLLQANDTYRFDVDAYGVGSFKIHMHKRNGFDVFYPEVGVGEDTFATIFLNGSFGMTVDYDGNGVYEKSVLPHRLVEMNGHNMLLRILEPNDPAEADFGDVLFAYRSNATLTDESISWSSSSSNLSGPDFYTLNSYVTVSVSPGAAQANRQLILSFRYKESDLYGHDMAEQGLAVFDLATGIALPSVIDKDENIISAVIPGTGSYFMATSDRRPRIQNVTVTPKETNIPSTKVSVSAIITDDDAITNATVTLGGKQAVITLSSGVWYGNITGPAVSGRYPLILEAADSTENIVQSQKMFTLDQEAPVIQILQPQNTTFITNRINLTILLDESANGTYVVDGVLQSLPSVTAYEPLTIPLLLGPGSHTISITTHDKFNNANTTSLSFSIAPQNVQVSSLSMPYTAVPNTSILVSAEVSNTLLFSNLTNVPLTLFLNGQPVNTTFVNLSGERSHVVTFAQTFQAGRFTAMFQAGPLAGEPVQSDNEKHQSLLVTAKIPILLIYDAIANRSRYEEMITQTADFDYYTYDVDPEGPFSQNILSHFRGAVWVSDDLGSSSSVEMRSYLQSRGRVVVISHNAGDSSILSDLGANFAASMPNKAIEGVFRDPIGNGLLFASLGGDSYATKSSEEALRYSGSESAAIRFDNGVYRTVLFGIALDSLPDRAVADLLMERALTWLDIDVTSPTLLALSPPQNFGFPINTPNVTISLQTDENAECRYSNASNSFDLMTSFTQTGGASHATVILVQNGKNYSFNLACRDGFHNQNATAVAFFIYNRTFLPPVLQPIADQQLNENQTLVVQVNVTDPEKDPVTLSLQDVEIFGFVPIAARFQINGSTLTLKTNFTDAGTYLIRVVAADGFSSVQDDFQIVINNVNRKPQLTHPGNLTLQEDAYFQLQLQATDPDGDSITFSDNTPLLDVAPLGLIGVTPRQANVGTHTINFTVSDGSLSDSKLASWTVQNVNDPPAMAFIPPLTATENTPFMYQVQASDEDNNTIQFADNTTLFNISATGLISFTPLSTQKGTYYINITATDSLATVGRLLNLVIFGFNNAPNITQLQNLTVVQNSYLVVNITACDKDLDPSC